MPKWLIAVVVAAWVGAGVALYYGMWIPLVVLGGLGILAATSAGGILLAQRSALRAAAQTMGARAIQAKPVGESPDEATARRRDEAKRRHERNKRRRRKA